MRNYYMGASGVPGIAPPAPPATSYDNEGGKGDRSLIITLSTDVVFAGSGFSVLINGVTSETNTYFSGGQSAAGKYMRFDFGVGASKIINEIKWYQSDGTSHGTWKIQGNNSDWNDIGNSFTLGGAAAQIITEVSGNVTGYRYYQFLGVDGSMSSTPWLYEVEFKIADA